MSGTDIPAEGADISTSGQGDPSAAPLGSTTPPAVSGKEAAPLPSSDEPPAALGKETVLPQSSELPAATGEETAPQPSSKPPAATDKETAPPKSAAVTKPTYNFLTIEPTFTILNPELAEPIMKEFVEKTRTEKGCLYYGWSKCGDKLFCREAYVDGEAVLAHLGNVGPCIDALLKESAELDRISIHGPQA